MTSCVVVDVTFKEAALGAEKVVLLLHKLVERVMALEQLQALRLLLVTIVMGMVRSEGSKAFSLRHDLSKV